MDNSRFYMIINFIFTINTMICTILFPNGWITAPSIHAEIECHGELHYSEFCFLIFFIFFWGGGEQSSFLFKSSSADTDIETDSFVAPFRTQKYMTFGLLFVFMMYIKETRERCQKKQKM